MIIDHKLKKKIFSRDIVGLFVIFLVVFILKIGILYVLWDVEKIKNLIWPMGIVYFLVWISISLGLYMKVEREL